MKSRSNMQLLLLLMADLLSNAISQAPGDVDVICTTPSVSILPPSYPPNFRVLMDSYHYLNLIRGPWQQVNVDGDDTQWMQSDGGQACRRSMFSCNRAASSRQNNWLILQHIRRVVSGSHLSHVNIQIDYRMSDCNMGCQNSFNLELWETSAANSMESRNTLNYRRLATILRSNSSTGLDKQETIQASFITNETGFYLAVVDEGSCITILRVVVFYYVCPAMVTDLIIHPEVKAPPISPTSGAKLELGQCINGTVGVPTANISLSCSPTGVWSTFHDGAHCRCDPGFAPFNDASCRACPVGEYSSIHRKCLVCPAKSWTNESAAEICQCLDGYFRASGETADYPCTKPPGKPTPVEVISHNSTFILLEWDPPLDNGGRNDTRYTLWYQETGSLVIHKLYTLTSTTGIVSGVQSNGSSYSVFLSAENGVSSFTNFSMNDLVLVITIDPSVQTYTSLSNSTPTSSFTNCSCSIKHIALLLGIFCIYHLYHIMY